MRAMFTRTTPRGRDATSVVLLIGIIGLTLTTAYVHYSLGGLLFLLNALGYVALAAALVVAFVLPTFIVQQLRWVPRVALIGYAAVTIIAWAIMGPYFSLAYFAKTVEVLLIGLLLVDLYRTYGTPAQAYRRARIAITEFRGGKLAGA